MLVFRINLLNTDLFSGVSMKKLIVILQIILLILITSCKSDTKLQKETVISESIPLYEYRIGLGFGFLEKKVQVTIDGEEVIIVVGTTEIEDYAQLQGTKMLASGSSPNKDITVRVTVNGGQSHEQSIDLSLGMYVHVYLEETGLRVYNTQFLVQE